MGIFLVEYFFNPFPKCDVGSLNVRNVGLYDVMDSLYSVLSNFRQ